VAARIAETTGKPTILVSFQQEVGRGSGRTTNGVHLREALAACGEHLVAHGGHAAAAGLEVRRECFDAFRTRFAEVCATMMQKAPTVAIDGTAQFSELDPHSVRKLEMLGPFGMGHRRPRFGTANVAMVGQPQTDVRGQDLKLRVVRDGQMLPARAVRASHRFEEVRERKGPWTLVYTPRLNPRGEEGPVYLEVHELHAV
jgi:single-stranded-DNA-specific exonuclease